MKSHVAILALVAFVVVASALPDGYQKLSAAKKMDYLWDRVTADPTEGSFPSALKLAGIFVESMNPSFDNASDEFPSMRYKLIHSVGTIAKCKFVASSGSPYTGMFQGGDVGLLRLSEARGARKGSYAFGFSLKLLRDGMESANQFALFNLAGDSNPNFFANPFTNHPPLPADAGFAEKALKAKFSQASMWPTLLGTSEFASFDQKGNKVDKPVIPFELVFENNPDIVAAYEAADTDPVKYHANYYASKLIPEGTALISVMCRPQPEATPVECGKIVTTTPFVSSLYADDNLFFQHTRIEDDFKLRPEWEKFAPK